MALLFYFHFYFYLNTLVLIPFLYQRKKWVAYLVSLAIIVVAVSYVQPFDQLLSRVSNNGPGAIERTGPPPFEREPPPGLPPSDNLREDRPPRGIHTDIISLFILIIILILSMAIHIRQQVRKAEQQALQAVTDKVNAELSFLKAQINPHFLFNTLNNLYSLAIAKSDNAPQGILRLSNIMRYVTDEVKDDYVPLAGEIECIKDYLYLQQ